jgi:hypothetical protein
MSALSTHHKRTKRSDKKKQESEELKQVTKSSESQEQSLTQAKIDSLRQGQRLDAIDQNPKHDSSKTEVTLDAVMLKAEGKPGAKQSRNSQNKVFPSHRCNSPKMMHSQSPVHNKFFKNQTSLPLVRSLLPKFSALLAHAHIKSKKDLKLPLKLKLPLNRCYAMNTMQEV